AALADGDLIEADQLLPAARASEAANAGNASSSREASPSSSTDAPVTLEQLERRHILRVLEEANGNRERAAAILGISARTLYRKLREYETGATA
ncbi:MAG TPA: helix-turn-helix domain-containing protein, partial [Pyrinomonadaceae bacterium]|nr:helix-turn-helix domain-containing protein [Pyrinomonadaceae bacterium]